MEGDEQELEPSQEEASQEQAGGRGRRWLRRVIVACLVLFVLYNILCLLVIPPLARSIGEKKLAEKLQRNVEIGSIRIHPYALSVRVRDFRIDGKDQEDALLAFDEFYINLQSRSLFRLGPVLSEVALTNPSISVERRADGTLSISDLIEREEPQPAPEEEKESKPLRFLVEQFRVVNGQFSLVDRVKGVTHTIRNLNLAVPLVSNMEDFVDQPVQPTVQADVNTSALRVEAGSKPFTYAMDTGVELNFERIDLPFYFAYVPVETNFRPLAGELSIRLRADFERDATTGGRLMLSGEVELTGLELVDMEDKPLFSLPEARLKMAPSDLLARDIRIDEIHVREPEIHAARDTSGALNLLSLVELPAGQDAEPGSSPATVIVSNLSVEDGRVAFSDLSGTQPLEMSLHPINIRVAGLGTAPGQVAECEVSVRLGEGEAFDLSGTISLSPPQADLNIALDGLGLARFQGYVPTDFDVTIGDGRLATAGRAQVAVPADETAEASYKGTVTLEDLLVTDRAGMETFLELGAFAMKGLDFSAFPPVVSIDELSLREFRTEVRREEDGALNLTSIAPPPPNGDGPEASQEGEQGAAPPPVAFELKRLLLRGGQVNVADLSVTPDYETSISEIDATVDGFVLGGAQPVTLDLGAVLDEYAAFSAQGRAKPDPAAPLVDMTCELSNLSMPRLSPYSRQSIGFDIAEGKFNLTLQFLLDNKELEMDPRLVLEQFTLGEKVDRDKLKGMPVTLAIAILKDRNGEIKLHVPITGRLDDPTFHVREAIVQFFVSLLQKAATSPFALLASVVPGGEDLNYVEFDAGSSTITPAAREKLDALVTALYERPALELVIDAYADPVVDAVAMQKSRLMERLEAQKQAMAESAGKPADEAAAVEVRPDEYPALLRAAFMADGAARMLGASGSRAGVSTGEMEALMLARFAPSEEDIRALARARAEAVRSTLLASEKVEASRISLGTPDSLSPKEMKGIAAGRVEFRLQ